MRAILIFFLCIFSVFSININGKKWLLMMKVNKTTECKLPKPCKVGKIHEINNIWANRIFSTSQVDGIVCQLNSVRSRRIESMNITSNWLAQTKELCQQKKQDNRSLSSSVEFLFDRRDNSILDRRSNIRQIIDLMRSMFPGERIVLKFTHLKKISIDLDINQTRIGENDRLKYELLFVETRFEFYTSDEGKRIDSCAPLLSKPRRSINSLLQIPYSAEFVSNGLVILNCEFRTPICPLLFLNASFEYMYVSGLVDTYFRRNMLEFINDELDFNADIFVLCLYKSENIVLDQKLLNQVVFLGLERLYVFESVRRIDNYVFQSLLSLRFVQLEASYFRKLTHRQGIKWLQERNSYLTVDIMNSSDIKEKEEFLFQLNLRFRPGEEIEDVLPDEDMCLYKNFPFNHLIFISLAFDETGDEKTNINFKEINDLDRWNRRSCTYDYLSYYIIRLNEALYQDGYDNLSEPKFYNLVCDSETKINNLCHGKNKIKLKLKDFWDLYDWISLNQWSQLICNILILLFSLFGIITNLTVAFIILRKDNQDIFKGFKHYSYLCNISLFNIFILVIQILSWMSDCKETTSIFCPDTRRYVPIQFFKIIFKEAAIPALRFMSNFSYVAFAFNRISLIGKDHPKLVEFFTKTSSKRYLLVTVIISLILSVVKGFRYHVNYDRAELQYPFSIEDDLLIQSSWTRDLYVVANVCTDLLNYFVFVLINLSIDIYMLVRLRATLDEKTKRVVQLTTQTKPITASSSKNKKDSKSKNNQVNADICAAMENAIRMVVFSSVLNLLFKLPLIIVPLLNAIAEFTFKSYGLIGATLPFEIFFESITRSRLIYLIADLADLLYTILISCHLFIYVKFDHKIKLCYDRLFKKSQTTRR